MQGISPKNILLRHELKPKKLLGQSFLNDHRVLRGIIQAADLSPRDVVLEVGPGLGVLTLELAKIAKKVVSVEKDPEMVHILKESLKNKKNVKIIEGDILKTKLVLPKNYKIVANIPYYITSPLLRMFLERTEGKAKLFVLMVQKEVAQRICAKPPQMSMLAVSVQFYAKPEIVSYVSKACFWPQPKVDSAVLRITPYAPKPSINPKAFFEVVRAGFKQPRKQLGSNLAKGLLIQREKIEETLLKNGISPKQRAESLSVADWERLAKTL